MPDGDHQRGSVSFPKIFRLRTSFLFMLETDQRDVCESSIYPSSWSQSPTKPKSHHMAVLLHTAAFIGKKYCPRYDFSYVACADGTVSANV